MKQHLFGTDGIRHTVGQSPLTLHELPLLGMSIGRWISEKKQKDTSLLLACDPRISSSFIKAGLESGLLLNPLIIYDAQILPTPAVCRLVKQEQRFKSGIIITASHNPYYDNGIKLVDENGSKLSKQDETIIENLVKSEKESVINYNVLGNLQFWQHATDKYVATICSFFPTQFLDGITIAIDCANGATSSCAPSIFKQLGASVTAIHNNPNGININENCGAQHTQDLVKVVKEHHFDIGLAFDGDGDRLVVISKDGTQKNGDDILMLLLQHPLYKDQKTVVGTIISNKGLEKWLEHNNKKLIRTAVGEPAVIEQLKKDNLILGGEPSGHVIITDYLDSSDAIYTALRLLEVIIATHNWELATFEHYPQVNLSIPTTIKQPLDKPPLSTIIKSTQNQLPHGRLIVRYSGTEPLLRITVENHDKNHAQYIAQIIEKQLKHELSGKGDE